MDKQMQGRERRRALIERLNQKEEALRELELRQQPPSQNGKLTEDELAVQLEIEYQRARRGLAGF